MKSAVLCLLLTAAVTARPGSPDQPEGYSTEKTTPAWHTTVPWRPTNVTRPWWSTWTTGWGPYTTSPAPQYECPLITFSCARGEWERKQCVSFEYRCNGYQDCYNGRDEEDCEIASCPDMMFTCGSGRCIHTRDVCNGRQDCEDKSDEALCETGDRFDNCPKGTFMCDGSYPRCISEDHVCNGYPDCQYGSDERNCYERCPPMTFHCPPYNYDHEYDASCISDAERCDGEYNCWDGSDERGCGGGGFNTTWSPEYTTTRAWYHTNSTTPAWTQSAEPETTRYPQSTEAETTRYPQSTEAETTWYPQSTEAETTWYPQSTEAETTWYPHSTEEQTN